MLKKKLEEQSTGKLTQSGKDSLWRLKKDGEMNYDRKGLKESRPNIIVNSYNRDFQRKNDTLKFYAELKDQ